MPLREPNTKMSEESNTDELSSDKDTKQPPKKRVKKVLAPKKDKTKKEETSKKEKPKKDETEAPQKEERDEQVESTDENEDKPKKGKSKGSRKIKKLDHPKTIDMIVEALENLEEKQGTSVQAIKSFIVENYKVREDMIKSMIKRALAAGLKDGILARPKNQESISQLLSGRYILCPKKEESDQPPKPRPSKLRQFSKSPKKSGQKSKKKKRKGFY